MDHVRRAGFLALLVAAALAAAGPVVPASPVPRSTGTHLAAAVTWPTSLVLVSEVMTGGATASDEFAELTNAGSTPFELMGYELVYVTASGSTVTRKAAWTEATILHPGRHLLVANTAGTFAAGADATYSGGFAATGGSLVLRAIGGEPLDAVGWGDASSGFVEGSSAAAPAAGSTIERLPGGALGNGADTNDNAADFVTRSAPGPQNLAAPPTPDHGASPTPPATSPSATPTDAPTSDPTSTPPTPTSVATPTHAGTPGPTPSPADTPMPTHPPTPAPSPTPTPAPSLTSPPSPTPEPSPSVTATPTSSPEPTPSATVTPIADARIAPDGTVVTVSGVLTTPLGAVDAARIGFVQDDTGGIAVRLDAAFASPIPAGTHVTVTGSVGGFFSLRVVNAAGSAIDPTGPAPIPAALVTDTGAATEELEGQRLTVSGTVVGSPSSLADGLGITIDDGTGELRIIASADALGSRDVAGGDLLTATGPLGQRDSSGTGSAGYRLHATSPAEISIVVAPTPTPTASPSPSPAPTASVVPSPTATPAPSGTVRPSPSPSPAPTSPTVPIAEARARPLGSVVSVAGVVTAEAGRLGTPALVAIQDATGGIVVKLPDEVLRPARGTWLEVRGPLADPYGQIEVRPAAAGVAIGGAAPLPVPAPTSAPAEASEGRLVVVTGTAQARPSRATSGDITFFLDAPAGPVRITADASSGLTADAIAAGATYRVVGVGGQRASRKGAADGYRVWARDPHDVTRLAGPSPSSGPGPSATPGPPGSGSGASTVRSIADAIRAGSGDVAVEGVVTTSARLLDSSGRRIVIEDRTAGLEILMPVDARVPAVGSRIRVEGEIGRAYDAPRLRATAVSVVATGARPVPLALGHAPTAAHEWRLVRVSGTVTDVAKQGDRWRAELAIGGDRVAIAGLAGAGIPVTTLVEGRPATIVGIARRPYPGATDRRWAVTPRGPADVTVGGAREGGPEAVRDGQPADGPGASSAATGAGGRIDVDLAALADHVGLTVRVGGLVTELFEDGFGLDDGTAIGRVVLRGDAAAYLPLLEAGDALNATGRVDEGLEGFVVVVEDPAGIVRVGDPGAPGEPLGTAETLPDGGLIRAGDGRGSDPTRHAGDLFGSGGLGPVGVAGVGLASLASVAVTLLRRHRARRLLAVRVAARVASVGRGPADRA